MTEFEETRRKLAERWQHRSPKAIGNRLSTPLFGGAGEWDLPADITPKKDLLYLAVGIPDVASLPKAQLQAASVKTHSLPGDLALRYGFGPGPNSIRQWLANHRNKLEGTSVNEDWFQMTNGSSGAIDLIVRSIIDPGDIIIAENPTYMGTLHNFRAVGADIRFVSVDRHGMNIAALDTLLTEIKREGKTTKLVYTISAFHNPTGYTLSQERRERLIEVAFKHDVLILDDEAYRELWYDKPPPPALSAMTDGYGVITTGTFSKTVATGIRAGYIHARPEILALFGRMRFAMGQNQLGLRAFGAFLDAGDYEPHLEHIRDVYREKRDVLDRALKKECSEYLDWEFPEGGFYLWASLKQGIKVTPLWRTAVEEGIAINPGTGFSQAGSPPAECIRIAYAWTPIEQFEEAAARLRIACERVVAGNEA